MKDLLTAALVGLSISDFWFCSLYSFSVGVINKWAALEFIIGRMLGLCLLGVWIGILGCSFPISPKLLKLIFGIITLIFGIWTILRKRKESPKGNIGFGLGFLRGATPCFKLFLIVPLILTSNLFNNLLLVLVYAISSSVYPVIGFLSANLAGRVFSHRKTFKMANSVVLILVGIYYIFKFL